MLDCLMADVLEKLPLSEETTAALLNHEGLLGKILDFTLAYERSEWDRLAELTTQLRLDPATIRSAYLKAVTWTMEITSELNI
jgi:EAL and modified HD-GYP domain-containing signal transduction protein